MLLIHTINKGAQWLSGRVLDSRPRIEPHPLHCVVSLSKNIKHNSVLVQPRKTCPYMYITEQLLIGHKESNQTNTMNQYLIEKYHY